MSSGVVPRRRTCRAASTKRFFGYSDNTNPHLFLWNLGLVSYLGSSLMVQFGWPVTIHPVSRQSLGAAWGGSLRHRASETP
jgi:muramoyltetrapeptide carboxypeptidase LdcA involved in peptidoglycan recycling